MELGAFSVSLSVTDIEASRVFYEKLGFEIFGGVQEQGWLILRNGGVTLGLFQGMFPKNTLTFNPKWTDQCAEVVGGMDIREIQRRLKAQGLVLDVEADEQTTGPAHFALTDPDGNPILFDQHV